jgi:fumarate reductase subunit D
VISCNLILDLVFSVIDCHDKLGFGSLYTEEKSGHLQSLFQSWITNGNIEQLPFHHYWSDWHRCQHHQHSGNIMVGDCLFSDNRFRF